MTITDFDSKPTSLSTTNALILKYAEGASDFGRAQLLTLFNFAFKRKATAEALADAYLHQIDTLAREVARLRDGGSLRSGSLRSPEPKPKAKQQPTPVDDLIVDLDDL